jgi:hypothetical protein
MGLLWLKERLLAPNALWRKEAPPLILHNSHHLGSLEFCRLLQLFFQAIGINAQWLRLGKQLNLMICPRGESISSNHRSAAFKTFVFHVKAAIP